VPTQLLGDLLALTGDRDEAPGVRGIGVKTAAAILRDHSSLERAIDRWALIPGRASALLRDQADAARLSRRLVALRDDLPLPLPIESLRAWNPSRSGLDRFFARYGFARYEAAVDAYQDGPR
jgi:DNA polymerase-1